MMRQRVEMIECPACGNQAPLVRVPQTPYPFVQCACSFNPIELSPSVLKELRVEKERGELEWALRIEGRYADVCVREIFFFEDLRKFLHVDQS